MKITLRAARINKGYTQQEVAKVLECSTASVQNWENGIKKVKTVYLKAFAELYSVPVEDFDLTPCKSRRCSKAEN